MELLLELDTDRLDRLRRTFLRNGGLERHEFVATMLELLPAARAASPLARTQTVTALHDAFAQVDVNGDGSLSWEETMAALIDAGAPQGRAGASRTAFSFVEHEAFARATRHSMRVSRVRYVPELRLVAMCEEGSTCVSLYGCGGPRDGSPAEGMQRIGSLDTAVKNEAEGGVVFDVAYVAEQNLFALAVADFSLQFWDCRPLAYRMEGGATAAAAKGTANAGPGTAGVSDAARAQLEAAEADAEAAAAAEDAGGGGGGGGGTKRPQSVFGRSFAFETEIGTVRRRRRRQPREPG